MKKFSLSITILTILISTLLAAGNRFTGPKITLDLTTKNNKSKGLEYVLEHEEVNSEFVKRAGSGCYKANKYTYFRVTDKRFRDGKLPLIKIIVEYYDQGKGRGTIKYDSLDNYFKPGTKKEGVFKPVNAIVFKNKREWKKAEIIIEDARFSGRCNEKTDWRFQTRKDDGLFIRKVTIIAASKAAQAANKKSYANRPKPPEMKMIPFEKSWEWVNNQLTPYNGPSVKGVDTSTVENKVMVGYQGWFGVPGDKTGRGFNHYGNDGMFEDGSCSIDYWPHTAEMPKSSLCKTMFKHKDGSYAEVFTSQDPGVVDVHFKWMKEAGIQGAFLQRFLGRATETPQQAHCRNVIIHNVRAAANKHGRSWAMMYDISGAENKIDNFKKDWKLLVDRMKIGKDPNDKAYQHYKGKPLVTIWGLYAKRPPSPEFCLEAVKFLKKDRKYGGYSVMFGVNNDWRTGKTKGHQIGRKAIKMADIVSPWTPGRYRSKSSVEEHFEKHNGPDIEWCEENDVAYMPVNFPGFSWYNMKAGPFDQIPRNYGQFLWQQMYQNIQLGASMLYIAMFDEIDEGTAICKVSDNPPVGKSKFLTYEGLPDDHYMWISGLAQKMLEGKYKGGPVVPMKKGIPVPKFLKKSDTLSTVLKKKPVENGINFIIQEKESDNVFAKGGKRGGYKNKTSKMYFRVANIYYQGGAMPGVLLEIDYFDKGNFTFNVVYDSSDKDVVVTRKYPGAWKKAGTVSSTRSGKWKTASIKIDDAFFGQRCNGFDFRLEFEGKSSAVIGAMRLKKRKEAVLAAPKAKPTGAKKQKKSKLQKALEKSAGY